MKYIGRSTPKGSTMNLGIDPRLVIAGILLLLTFLMIWLMGKMLFGGKEKHEDTAEQTVEQGEEETNILQTLSDDVYAREANLQGLSGHAVSGAAQMRITFSDYEMIMAATLPPIDPAAERYEAWMLQPGIADYFSVGTFFARADGWYGLVFKENLAHVPANPQTYTRILITRESLRDDKVPSNIRVAEGFFNL